MDLLPFSRDFYEAIGWARPALVVTVVAFVAWFWMVRRPERRLRRLVAVASLLTVVALVTFAFFLLTLPYDCLFSDLSKRLGPSGPESWCRTTWQTTDVASIAGIVVIVLLAATMSLRTRPKR
jgi:cell division protein FtsW (lipid II flippase)